MNENVLLVLLIILFIIFISINRAMAGSPMERITFEAGIGCLLVGTFFGVVRLTLLKKQPNFRIALMSMIGFFIWYVCTKGLSSLFINSGTMTLTGSTAGNEDKVEIENEQQSAEKIQSQKLPDVYGAFIAAIVILLTITLLIAFYAQKNQNNDKHLVNFLIMMTVLTVLSGMFTTLSGKKISNEMKIKILAYTIAFALVFGVFCPIFVFKNFSFSNLIISTLIFFVWLTLTYSFANFMTEKPQYIERAPNPNSNSKPAPPPITK